MPWGDYENDGRGSGSVSAPIEAAALMPAEQVVDLMNQAGRHPTTRSATTILRLVKEQAEQRERSYLWAWFFGALFPVITLLVTALDPGPINAGMAMLWMGSVAAPVFIAVQVSRNRPLIARWRRERAEIEAAAVANLIALSDLDLRHAGLHQDRVTQGRSLIKIGGEQYRLALIKILDNAAPVKPLAVPANL